MKSKTDELKDFFKKSGITQEEIAKRLHVSRPVVSSLINGKPFGKRTAMAWSEAFGLSPMWLMTGEGDMLISGSTSDSHAKIDAHHVQIGDKNTMVQMTESERLIALIERRDEEIKQRNKQIDDLIELLKQQMNK